MINIKDFHVGDEVITVINERDYVNGGRKDTIRKEKVMSVGRKYVQVTRFEDERFTNKFLAIDWDCVAVTNIKHDHNDERFNQYCVSFTACNRDYQILIRINKQLEDYYWYAR